MTRLIFNSVMYILNYYVISLVKVTMYYETKVGNLFYGDIWCTFNVSVEKCRHGI